MHQQGEGKKTKSKNLLLLCPSVDFQQKLWAIVKACLSASRFGLKMCVFPPQDLSQRPISSSLKIWIKGVRLPTSKVQTKRGFTYFKPSRKLLKGVPSVSELQFISDIAKLTTKPSRHIHLNNSQAKEFGIRRELRKQFALNDSKSMVS